MILVNFSEFWWILVNKYTSTFLLALLCNISLSHATTYYVDAVNWLDTHNGLLPNSAIKTLTKASQLKLVADDSLLLAGGISLKDYIPKNISLIKNKGIHMKRIPHDVIGLNVGLSVAIDILGNKISGLSDIGAIEIQ